MTSRIVTLTMNPSIDRTLSIAALRPGAIHRATAARQDLGGKGINVSRALSALGIASRIVALSGGRTGEALLRGLVEQGFEVDAVRVAGETRQNVTLFDEESSVCTKVNEPGPSLDDNTVAAILVFVAGLVRPGDLWVLSGSLPPGAPADFYGRLVSLLQSRGARAFVDTSEAALASAVAFGPFCVKPNWEEASALLRSKAEKGSPALSGAEPAEEAEELRAMHGLMAMGSQVVMLTLGARGLLLAMQGTLLRARPPEVRVRSPIGAGDATMAGLLWGLLEGCDADEIARRAASCGTAAAMQEGTGMPSAELVRAILPRVQVTSPL